jgi:hypothetical protein
MQNPLLQSIGFCRLSAFGTNAINAQFFGGAIVTAKARFD